MVTSSASAFSLVLVLMMMILRPLFYAAQMNKAELFKSSMKISKGLAKKGILHAATWMIVLTIENSARLTE